MELNIDENAFGNSNPAAEKARTNARGKLLERNKTVSPNNLRPGWMDRIKNGEATSDDLETGYQEWKKGNYTPGPKTIEEFNKLHPTTEPEVVDGTGNDETGSLTVSELLGNEKEETGSDNQQDLEEQPVENTPSSEVPVESEKDNKKESNKKNWKGAGLLGDNDDDYDPEEDSTAGSGYKGRKEVKGNVGIAGDRSNVTDEEDGTVGSGYKRLSKEERARRKEEKAVQKMFKKAERAAKAKAKANGGVGIWKTNDEMYDEFLKKIRHPMEEIFGKSGLSFGQRAVRLGAILSGLAADGMKGYLAGYRGQPLPTQSTLKDVDWLKNAWGAVNKNLERKQKVFDTENQGKIDQADRVARIKNSLFLQGWPENEITDLAYQLQGPEMTEDQFNERYFGKTEDEQIEKVWQKRGKYPRSEEDLNGYMNAAYQDYKNARVTYTPGSVGRQNLQAERANEQAIQKTGIDLAYYGTEKELSIEQNKSTAMNAISNEITRIEELRIELENINVENYAKIFEKYISMGKGIISSVTTNNRSDSTSGGASGKVGIKGIADISGNFNKTVGEAEGATTTSDVWAVRHQENAEKAAEDWQKQYGPLKQEMIETLKRLQDAYQERFDAINGLSDERLKVIRQKLGYDGSGKYNRDPQYYINRLKGGMA